MTIQIANSFDKVTKEKIIKSVTHILLIGAIAAIVAMLSYLGGLIDNIKDPTLAIIATQVVGFLYNVVKEYSKGQNINIDKTINNK